MKRINREIIESIKEEYPKGTRVELLKMADVQTPPIGTRGTVKCVDSLGLIIVNWDNGSTLSVVYGEDLCKKI